MSRFPMTRLFSAAALPLLIVFAVACGDPASDTGSDEGADAEISAEKVKKEVREAAAAVRIYSFEQKDEFAEWSKKRIERLDDRLAEFRKQGKDLAGEAKQEWQSTLADLEKRRKELDAQLESTLDSSAEGWSELQSGFAQAQKDLAKAIRQAGKELGGEDEAQDEAQDEE